MMEEVGNEESSRSSPFEFLNGKTDDSNGNGQGQMAAQPLAPPSVSQVPTFTSTPTRPPNAPPLAGSVGVLPPRPLSQGQAPPPSLPVTPGRPLQPPTMPVTSTPRLPTAVGTATPSSAPPSGPAIPPPPISVDSPSGAANPYASRRTPSARVHHMTQPGAPTVPSQVPPTAAVQALTVSGDAQTGTGLMMATDATPASILTPLRADSDTPAPSVITTAAPPQPLPSAMTQSSPPGAFNQGYQLTMGFDSPPAVAAGDSQQTWGFFPSMLNKVVASAKQSVDMVITTLDPQMKELIRSGGNINVVVASTSDLKVSAVREAFQTVFGRATVSSFASTSSLAPQLVGYTAGIKGTEDVIRNARLSGEIGSSQAVIAVESTIVEITPNKWFEVQCVVFQDPEINVELHTFSQATPVPLEYVLKAQQSTPADYGKKWSGLSVTIGEVIRQSYPHVPHTDWHQYFGGVSSREGVLLAAKQIACLYRDKLPQPSPTVPAGQQ